MFFDEYMKQFAPTHRETQAQKRIDAELAAGRYGDPDDYEIIKGMLDRKRKHIDAYQAPTKEEFKAAFEAAHPLPTDGMNAWQLLKFFAPGIIMLVLLFAGIFAYDACLLPGSPSCGG